MKKRTKVILGLAMLLGATLALGACSYPHAPYGDLAENDFGVQVRYDRNGGIFSSTEGIEVVDVYEVSRLENGVKLVEPGDPRRKEQASTSTPTRSGYFLAGWYRTRTPRADEAGNPLDDYGVPCSQSGRPQGYVYDGKWDFSNDYLHLADVTPIEEEKGSKYSFTLYAGWVPNFTYTFLRPAEEGESDWQAYGTFIINPLNTTSIAVPAWNLSTGRMDYGSMPVYENHTVTGVFADKEEKVNFEKEIPHTGTVDYATGTATGFDVPVYTTWRSGVWYRISDPGQIISNVAPDGCYEITADLDFAGSTLEWPFANIAYSGTFDGQGHKITNVSTTQFESSTMAGGLFGELTASATVKNAVFENVSFNLQRGTRLADGRYGLFAGRLDEAATVEGITLSGKILIGNLIDVPYTFTDENGQIKTETGTFRNFTIGLVSGNLVDKGINSANIAVEVSSVPISYDSKGNAVYGYPVKAEVQADGSVKITVNEDPSQDPNQS